MSGYSHHRWASLVYGITVSFIPHYLGYGDLHCLDSNGPAILDDDFVDLGVGGEVQVRVYRTSRVNVGMSAVASAACVAIDPLQPVLSPVGSLEVLEVIYNGDALRLGSSEEVILDRIGAGVWSVSARRREPSNALVSERHLDWTLKAMRVSVLTSTLIGLMLLHQRDKLLGGPALGLKVIIVRRRGPGVHLSRMLDMTRVKDQRHTMKLIDDPPPRMWAAGTIAPRPLRCLDGRDS